MRNSFARNDGQYGAILPGAYLKSIAKVTCKIGRHHGIIKSALSYSIAHIYLMKSRTCNLS